MILTQPQHEPDACQGAGEGFTALVTLIVLFTWIKLQGG